MLLHTLPHPPLQRPFPTCDLQSFRVKNRSFSPFQPHSLSHAVVLPLTLPSFTIHHTNLLLAFADDDDEDFGSFFSASRPLRPDFSSPSFFVAEDSFPFFLTEAEEWELMSRLGSDVSPT